MSNAADAIIAWPFPTREQLSQHSHKPVQTLGARIDRFVIQVKGDTQNEIMSKIREVEDLLNAQTQQPIL